MYFLEVYPQILVLGKERKKWRRRSEVRIKGNQRGKEEEEEEGKRRETSGNSL